MTQPVAKTTMPSLISCVHGMLCQLNNTVCLHMNSCQSCGSIKSIRGMLDCYFSVALTFMRFNGPHLVDVQCTHFGNKDVDLHTCVSQYLV